MHTWSTTSVTPTDLYGHLNITLTFTRDQETSIQSKIKDANEHAVLGIVKCNLDH